MVLSRFLLTNVLSFVVIDGTTMDDDTVFHYHKDYNTYYLYTINEKFNNKNYYHIIYTVLSHFVYYCKKVSYVIFCND